MHQLALVAQNYVFAIRSNKFHKFISCNDSLSFFTFFRLKFLPLSPVTVQAIIKVQEFSNHFKKVLFQKREQFFSKKTFSYLLNDKLVRLRR